MLFWDRWLKSSVLQNLIQEAVRARRDPTNVLSSSSCWPVKIQRSWVTCQKRQSQIGTKSRLEFGSPHSSFSFTMMMLQIKNNYYLSSICLGPGIILDTVLTAFIYSFINHLLSIFCVPATIREGNMVMNKARQAPVFKELTFWCVVTELCPRRENCFQNVPWR